MDKKENTQQYIYIVQVSFETASCKIGKTNDLERRLGEYNNITGKSKNNIYQYLFTCEVSDMTTVENDIKEEFEIFREEKRKEIYFFNSAIFKKYVDFIKKHPLFIKEILIEKKVEQEIEKVIQYVKKTTPTLEERKLSPKDLLQKAQKTKNDEFYTRYEDIEKEIEMYDKNIWKDKCVFCNCDDAVGNDENKTSAFALYFLNNFKKLKLKKLICTHYGDGVDLFNAGVKGYIFTKDGYSKLPDDYEKMKEYPKNYDGSFDHPISIKILEEDADIVCTNPPFSRAIDYWKLITGSGKKFLIISNITNTVTTAYIHYFKNNKVWAGYNRVDWYENNKKQFVDASGHWYTNLPVIDRPKYKRLKIMPLAKIPEKYKQYDDSKTLIVDNCYIPSNYKKPFAISTRPILNGLLEKGYKIIEEKTYAPYINNKCKFARVLVQKI